MTTEPRQPNPRVEPAGPVDHGQPADADAGLRWTVRHAANGAPFFADKLASAGLTVDDITGVGDLSRLPFTTKDELRACSPFGWTAVPMRDVVRIHSSSGTTGRRTICTYTERDIEHWTDMFARCYRYAGVGADDRVQIAVGYGLWTAGVGFQLGAERVGALAVPSGPGNTDLQLELAAELGSTVLGATASFALLLAEEVTRRGERERLALRTGIFGSERWGEGMRRRIESLLDIESFDVYGLTELWGPGTGIECREHDGIHVWSDHYLVEIIDPESLRPVAEGAVGEVVLTTFGKEGTPLLRYRTRDLSRLITEPCPCGSPHPRIARLSGRSDDVVKVRGVMLLPAQVDVVLADVEGAGSEFQVHVSRDDQGHDVLVVRVEGDGRAATADELRDRLRRLVGLRFDVEMVAVGDLPRSERKTTRMFDHRDA